MRKIILYAAISADDFIADKQGQIDWLSDPQIITEGEDYGYADFYASIDTTLMGNTTYNQVMGFGGDFPYPDKTNYVITGNDQLEDTRYVKFISSDIPGFCSDLRNEPGKDIWLVGGGKLNTALLEAGLVDTLILTKMPVPLGAGIPLFHDPAWRSAFRQVSTKMYEKGVLQMYLEASNY